MLIPPAELARRRLVWEPLSRLFLDTELEPAQLEEIATILAASGYTPAELDDILFTEVYPICSPNLNPVAGEWRGFSLDWLEEQIVNLSATSLSRSRWTQFKRGIIRDKWRTIGELVAEKQKRRST